MNDALPLKYRPQTFADIVGQRITPTVLHQMVVTSSVPSGMLFAGPSGSGKTTAARILARALNPEPYAYTEVDAASNGGVDAVRAMIDSLAYGTFGPRVIVYDEAQSMTREAFNALLKTVEEPPADTYFILVTTEPEKIPETVKTRLMEFEFQRVPSNAVFDRLVEVARAEQIQIAGELLKHLADKAAGNLRTALTLLDQVHRAGIATLPQFATLMGEEDFAPRLLAAIASGQIDQVHGQLDAQLARTGNVSVVISGLVHCLTDLLVLRSGGSLSYTGPALDERAALATRLGPDRIVAALRLCWELRTRVRASDDPVANAELVLVLMSDQFKKAAQPAPAPAPPAVQPLPRPATVPPVAPAAAPLSADELRRRLTGR